MRIWSLAAMGGSTPAASTVFLINEDCEGTGRPGNFTDANGTPNWDYTTVPLEGAQSLYLSLNGAAARARSTDFTTQTEAWMYCLVRFTNGTNPSALTGCLSFGAPGGTAVANTLQVTTGMKLRVAGTTNTTDSVVIDTTYHLWFHYKKGTGADAVIDVGFSTDGVRPTSGNKFAQSTSATDTNDIGRLHLGTTATTLGMDMIVDKIRVAATQIGDNGA